MLKILGMVCVGAALIAAYWLGREMERQRVHESYERAEKAMSMTPTAWEEWKENA